MLSRTLAEQIFQAACRACDPERAVEGWLRDNARTPTPRRFGVAIGKASVAMARGAGPVHRGIVVTVDAADHSSLPAGWRAICSAHPLPDERSLAAAREVIEVIEAAGEEDEVLALISGGASALIEQPLVPLAELASLTNTLMDRGVPVGELNAVRGALSAIKAGGLALRSRAPIVTLVASDVIGDDPRVIGSAPTIVAETIIVGRDPARERAEEASREAANDNATQVANDNTDLAAELASELAARRTRAAEILARHGLAIPAILREDEPAPTRPLRSADRASVVVPMARFAEAIVDELVSRTGRPVLLIEPPIASAAGTAAELVAERARAYGERPIVVAWGEPTVALPDDHGVGGRAQQLALVLAKQLRGSDRCALVLGSDGSDGPAPAARPTPAGAFVDGMTWDRIGEHAAELAITRCDAGTVLAGIDALVVTGPTGINHADVAIIG